MSDIRPQPGPQEEFLCLDVDFAVYGGAAGGGKSYALAMEGARYCGEPGYTGVMFRRKSTEIMLPGGIWDAAEEIYRCSNINARMPKSDATAYFPAGGRLKFSHLQYESTVYSHHSAAYAFIGFDELQTFTKKQFTYMMSRNRPGPGFNGKAYARAGCNPDAESWLRDFLAWYINPDTGYVIKERCGVVRYFTIEDNEFVWVDKDWRSSDGTGPKSFTFIEASIDDNKILMQKDPSYKANLHTQDWVTRERLLKGNWNATYKGGMFDPKWFKIETRDRIPKAMKLYRYWDMAATEVKDGKDPDFTAGVLGGMYQGEFWICDIDLWQKGPAYSEKNIKRIARSDGRDVAIGMEEEKGSAGKHVMSHYQKNVLTGYEFHADPVSGSKSDRATPWCALAEQGLVHLVDGPNRAAFLAQAAAFPKGAHRDMIDAGSGLYKIATGPSRVWPDYNVTMFKTLDLYKSPEMWKKLDPESVVVYSSIVADKDGSIHGNYYLWSKKTEKLWIYSEFDVEAPSGQTVYQAMREAIDIPFTEENVMYMAVRKVVGSESMFAGTAEDMSHQLRKAKIRVRPCPSYDLPGMTLRVAGMIKANQITVGDRCLNTDAEIRSWTMTASSPDGGYAHCIALCQVVSELKAAGQLDQAPELKPYTKKKELVRKRIMNAGLNIGTNGRTGDEYLGA